MAFFDTIFSISYNYHLFILYPICLFYAFHSIQLATALLILLAIFTVLHLVLSENWLNDSNKIFWVLFYLVCDAVLYHDYF